MAKKLVWFLLIGLFVTALVSCDKNNKKPKRADDELVIISYNVDADESTLTSRGPLMTKLINEKYPDSVGFQEARPGWLNHLEKELSDYDFVGVSADGEYAQPHSFGNYIFYLKDKYKVVDSGWFWHSSTPEVPSIYPGADCNRYCVWVVLENIKTGYKYAHINTHLNWLPNKAATAAGARMVRNMVNSLEMMGIPVFCSGDFNAGEKTETYNIMNEGSIGDSKYLTDDSMNIGTYPHYGDYDPYSKNPNVIDYIFVTKERLDVLQYRVLDDKPKGEYISDHFGIYVKVKLKLDQIEDKYKSATPPIFPESAKIEVSNITSKDAVIKFNAATDETLVRQYSIRVENTSGVGVFKKELSSGLYFGEIPNEYEVKITKGRLKPGETYTVIISSTNIFGQSTETPLKVEFDTPNS